MREAKDEVHDLGNRLEILLLQNGGSGMASRPAPNEHKVYEERHKENGDKTNNACAHGDYVQGAAMVG